jgi:hypothetical protein
MKSELNQLLRERYPKIFSQPCEISCGDGWFNILDSVCGCIQGHLDWKNRSLESNLAYNHMANSLVAGNDEPFLCYYPNRDEDFLQARRNEILSGERRETWEPCAQVVAQQVKEKFGSLRFYVSGGDSSTEGMIQMAETMSAVTCEQCGSPGTTGGSGWIQTLCHAHRLEKD